MMRRLLREKGGATMVELIVAVFVASLMFAMFSNSVTTAVKTIHTAREQLQKEEEFNRSYYRLDSIAAQRTAADGLCLEPDRKRADAGGQAGSEKISLSGSELRVYVDEELSMYTFMEK